MKGLLQGISHIIDFLKYFLKEINYGNGFLKEINDTIGFSGFC